MEFKLTPGPLTELWPEIKKLLAEGYSLIPVRERATADWPAKSPFSGWKEFQLRRMTEQELWNTMERHNTAVVAMLCGKVSGNIEAIDVDSKFKPGIDATLFSTIRELFPDLWTRLRIHKSPSGGFHILYKIEPSASVPGNKKLASRAATTEELAAKPKEKIKSFLETRGEGGYVLVPPSASYTVWKATDTLPVITWEERCSLIALCEGFSEIIKEPVKEVAPPKEANDYYDVNPFEDYNRSLDAEQTLVLHGGWTEYKRNNQFIWFTRPSTVRGGIHAAFLRDRRLFYFFTTNSEFDVERCYQPATVLSVLAHNGDKKRTFQLLVQNGFGRIKSAVEQRIATAAAQAGLPLPANASQAAQATYREAKVQADLTYPHGIFWEAGDSPRDFSIDREKLYRVAAGLGFRWYEVTQDILRIRDRNFIDVSSEREFYDVCKDYIKESNDDLFNAYEGFLQKSGKFSYSRLKLLEEDRVMKDTRTDNYKFYSDVWVHTTAQGNSVYYYNELPVDKLVWSESRRNRNFTLQYGGRYVDFLNKAVQYEKNTDYVERIIGFLVHNFKDAGTGYLPILTEICENPMDGGGAGKNLFCTLLNNTTSVLSPTGIQVKLDSGGKLLQSWNGERVFVISDVSDNFPYIMLKGLLTDDGKMEKKYKNEVIIPVEKMPKFVVVTNYSYEIKDGGMKRRIMPLEFTDFFTKCGGVDRHYGGSFPSMWTEEDWAGYNYVVHRSIQRWLASDLKINALELTETGWRKQFEESFGKVISGFIKEYWSEWKDGMEVKNADFKELLNKYCIENNIAPKFHPTSYRINQAFQHYAEHYGYTYKSDQKGGSGLLTYKFRQFLPPAPF